MEKRKHEVSVSHDDERLVPRFQIGLTDQG